MGLGIAVVHQCETVAAKGDHLVVHIVLSPRQPYATPLSDLEDAGYDVVAYGVLPEEIPECPEAAAYSGCEHLLLRL